MVSLGAAGGPPRHSFDIPAQPLDAALARYGDITGREALYDTSLSEGQVSARVTGPLTADEGLAQLLSTTGLSVRFVSDHAFVLLRPKPAGPSQPSALERRYQGLVQHNLLSALCRSEHARPGNYSLFVLFWLSPTGAVERFERAGSAGSPFADREFDAALARVRLNEPPPSGFEQPVLIELVANPSGGRPNCPAVAGERGMRPG